MHESISIKLEIFFQSVELSEYQLIITGSFFFFFGAIDVSLREQDSSDDARMPYVLMKLIVNY